MTLYIDIENKKLVQSITSDRSVSTPVFMQGDNEPLEIFLLEKGADTIFSPKALTVENDFLRVAIARFKGYPKSLTYASGYTLNPNGGAEVLLPLNTKDIEIALQEQEYISAFLEVEYSNTGGKVITVLQTACRVKNDLIDNAPTVELQEQFYDKVYVDEVFSKKSANLSDLADKAASRTNLGVYSKSEVDANDALALEKASNLSDLANKKQSQCVFKIWGRFKARARPTDYNYFYPAISADGSKLNVGYIYSYDSETGTDNSREVLFPISNPIKYGDKIAMTLDDRDFKLYKGLEHREQYQTCWWRKYWQ